MGYAEEIYSRAEKQFSNIDEAIAWLDSFENPSRGTNAYTRAGVKVRNELQGIYSIRAKVEREEDFEKLKDLKREVESLKFEDKDTISLIDGKMRKIQRELAELTETRRREREEQEDLEREIERKEMAIAKAVAKGEDAENVVAKYEREIGRLKSEDKRKRENAKRTLAKMKARGQIE